MRRLIISFLLIAASMNAQLTKEIDSVFNVNLSRIDTANARIFLELKNQKDFDHVFKSLDTTSCKYAIIEFRRYNRWKDVVFESKEYYFNTQESLPYLQCADLCHYQEVDSVTYYGLIKELNQDELIKILRYSKFQKIHQGGCIRFRKRTLRKLLKEELSTTYRIVFLIDRKKGTIQNFYNTPVKHPYFFLRVKNFGGGF